MTEDIDAKNPPIVVPNERPSLHEIAAMPYPQSELCMRKFVHPKWGKPVADGEPVKWKVRIHYETRERDYETYEVWATDEEGAREEAEALFDKDYDHDTEITDVDCKEVAS